MGYPMNINPSRGAFAYKEQILHETMTLCKASDLISQLWQIESVRSLSYDTT
jgi:hypothetical protein